MTVPNSTHGRRRSAGRGDFPGTPSAPRIRVRILAALFSVGILTCDWLAPANQAPQAAGRIADREVQVDGMVAVDVAGYFTDPDGDSLGYAARSSDLTLATVVVAGSTVTATGVAAGSATVTVTATDPEGLSAQQSFGVTVPNRMPVAVGTIADLEVEVDSAVVVGIAGYFADPDGDELAYAAVSSDPTRATVAVAGDTITVTGVAKGSVTVTVTATDAEGLSAEQGFRVTVPNRAPVTVGTVPDLEVEVDSAVAVELAGYFADPDGDELAYLALSSDTMRAGVAVVGDAVTVTGVAKGGATVTVTATDTEGLSAEQSFGVTVPNRAPVTVGTIADLEVEVDSAAMVVIGGHFADPDGDALAYEAVSSNSMRAVVGVAGDTLTVMGVAKGSVTVTVTARDPEGLAAEQVFGVTVPNRAPRPVGTIADLEVEVDSAVVVEIAGYFTDPDGDSLAYSASSSDATKASVEVTGSTVTVTGVAKGNATITLVAHDPEGLAAEQVFGVTVPNRAPEAVGTIADLEVRVDSAAAVDVLGYFADPDGDPLEYSVVSSDPARATVTLTASVVTVAGVAKGRVTVTVAAEDPEGLAAEQSFEVTVPNRAPEALGTIADLEVQTESVMPVDVAAYFADPDGDVLEYTVESSDTTRAEVTVAGSAVTVTGVAKGTVTVTVTARDPEGLSAEQQFGVRVPNRAPRPVGTIADLEVQVDSAAVVGIAAYFTDPDGDPLAYSASSSDATKASVEVTGSTATVVGVSKGNAAVTLVAQDPEGLSAEQHFVVTVPNRAPEAVGTIADLEVRVDGAAAVEVLGYFADPDGDPLEYSVVSSDPARATVTLTASVVTVAGVAKGRVTVTVAAEDPEGLAAEQSFEVTVPNRAPEALGTIADLEVQAESVMPVDVAAYFADPDGDVLEYTVESSDTTRAEVTVAGSAVTVTGVAKGTVTVTVTARDPEGLSAEQQFGVRVPNRAPRPVGTITDLEVQVDSAAVVGIAGYFTDPDGDPLAYSASSSDATKASVEVTGSTATVVGVSKGNAAVTLVAQDPEGLSAEQHFVVTVPNRAPGAVGTVADLEVRADGPVTVDVAAYFADPDGDVLEYAAESSDTSRATVAVTGSMATVTGVGRGNATVTVTATDPEGLSAQQSFAVTVPNRAPEAAGSIRNRVVARGSTTSVNASLHFSDPDGDDMEYSAISSRTRIATVRVSGDAVVVTGRAVGTTTITVTARDSAGLSAEQRFDVAVPQPNRPPQAKGTIPNRSAALNTEISVDVSSKFTDPDGDPLTYSATSSNTSVATVSTSNSTVTVTAEAAGRSTITVTASDPGGLQATQSFRITVRGSNRAPRAVGAIPDRVGTVGGAVSVEVSSYFTDPDGDDLEYSATSSNTSVATVGTSGTTVTVAGEAVGTATITVTARDPSGLTATQRFEVTVEKPPNRAPVVSGPIIDLLDAVPGAEYAATLARVFTDPDGDPLDYTASSTNTAVAEAEIKNDSIFVATHAVGSATVTVTATDPGGLSAADEFEVTVSVRPERFNIWLGWTDDVTETQKQRIRLADREWESVLRDTELADVDMPDEFSCLGITATAQQIPTVDDHLVLVDVRAIDGPGGTLAFAGYCYTRPRDGTPLVSAMVFDEADIDLMVALGQLGELAFHEFAHGLGFLSRYWDRKGLLDDGADPHFTGALAIEAFDAAGGTSWPGAKVPISVPDFSHWRDSVFGFEGMTGTFVLGVSYPFSAITLQAMADVGYVVDASLADDYQLPNTVPPDLAADVAGQVFDLSNDVVRGPVMVLDADGNIVRVIPPPPGTIVPSWPRREAQIERVEVRNGPTGEVGQAVSAQETIWRRVIRPAASGRSR